jgi:general stress protein YciG
VDYIKIDLREIGWDGMDWIDLAQDRDQRRDLGKHGNEHSGSIKCWEVLEWLHNWQLLKKGSAP